MAEHLIRVVAVHGQRVTVRCVRCGKRLSFDLDHPRNAGAFDKARLGDMNIIGEHEGEEEPCQ